MKISLDWLNDYVEITESAEQVADRLSDLGFPCEGMEIFDNDTVIDIEVTSNRGDCLGHIGVARELAAATGQELKIPAVELNESEKDIGELVEVEIAEPDLCGRYTARVIEGITVGISPEWMAKRLEAIGVRSVNNVVDATNYALIETGQPPHAFDYGKLSKGQIIVRRAEKGEKIVSIDGTERVLDSEMLIIADGRGPVAIAGVMGGLDTEVSDTTKTVLLEDAHFDPVSIRNTSRKLALVSEASFRFERIVDIESIDRASRRTAQLITQVAGGKVVMGVVDVYPRKWQSRKVSLRFSRLKKLMGIEIPVEKVINVLSSLGFEPEVKGGDILCSVPSWRNDISREVDLIEEAARHYGYNRVPVEERIRIKAVPVDKRQRFCEKIGNYLNGCGFYETITVTFDSQNAIELFTDSKDKQILRVRDVSRKSDNILRLSLLPSLMNVLKTNANAKNLPCRIFEIADVYIPLQKQDGNLPQENTMLSMVSSEDFRYLRGAIEGMVRRINPDVEILFKQTEMSWARSGAKILVNGEVFGSAGVVSQKVQDELDIKNVSPAAAEIDFEKLLALEKGPVEVKPIAKFPAIVRDLSIIIGEQVRWADIVQAVNKVDCTELEDIHFTDIYRGKGIPDGQKSLTLSLVFRDEEGTLTHQTVDEFEQKIVNSLKHKTKAELRTV